MFVEIFMISMKCYNKLRAIFKPDSSLKKNKTFTRNHKNCVNIIIKIWNKMSKKYFD